MRKNRLQNIWNEFHSSINLLFICIGLSSLSVCLFRTPTRSLFYILPSSLYLYPVFSLTLLVNEMDLNWIRRMSGMVASFIRSSIINSQKPECKNQMNQ